MFVDLNSFPKFPLDKGILGGYDYPMPNFKLKSRFALSLAYQNNIMYKITKLPNQLEIITAPTF